MKILHNPPSVGTMINELYLEPTNISWAQAAELCQIEPEIFEKIMHNQMEIGYELAYKLGKGFNTSHEFWLNVQRDSNK